MGRMILDMEAILKRFGDALVCPGIVGETKGAGAATQQIGDGRKLLSAQAGRRTRGGQAAQAIDTVITGALEPLAHRAGRYIKSPRNLTLFPTLLAELPGPEAPPLLPLWVVRYELCHRCTTIRCRLMSPPRLLPGA